MNNPTPEDLAKNFARRWFAHESAAMRALGEQELVKLMRAAAAGSLNPPAGREQAA